MLSSSHVPLKLLCMQDGCTPLLIACLTGQLECARLCVERGAKVDQADQVGGLQAGMAGMLGFPSTPLKEISQCCTTWRAGSWIRRLVLGLLGGDLAGYIGPFALT